MGNELFKAELVFLFVLAGYIVDFAVFGSWLERFPMP